MAYETEELWFDEWEHGGKPYYEDPAALREVEPGQSCRPSWKTPMLVIHSEKDFRIPYTQGIAAFTALQRRGIPSRLLVFPDENHWVLKPQQRRSNGIDEVLSGLGWLTVRLRHPGDRPRLRADAGSVRLRDWLDGAARHRRLTRRP